MQNKVSTMNPRHNLSIRSLRRYKNWRFKALYVTTTHPEHIHVYVIKYYVCVNHNIIILNSSDIQWVVCKFLVIRLGANNVSCTSTVRGTCVCSTCVCNEEEGVSEVLLCLVF